MRAVLQRVSEARVTSAHASLGAIGRGLVVLLGIARGDTEHDAQWMLDRLLNLRMFPSTVRSMDRSLLDAHGELLIVSQFTLFADTRKGRRPGFFDAASPEEGRVLYDHFVALARASGVRVATGRFGAMMELSLVNDGPVTIVLDSRERG